LLKTNVRFVDDFDKLQRVIHDQSIKMLFWIGDWARQRIKWKTKRRPPKRLTKKGRISKVYTREQTKSGPPRAPFRRTGLLSDLTAFDVDKKNLTVVAGPQYVANATDGSVVPSSGRTILQLLEEGGTASVPEAELTPWYRSGVLSHHYWRPTGRRTTAIYREFPFIKQTQDKAHEKFLNRLRDKGLT
jgi:hypothetical protein